MLGSLIDDPLRLLLAVGLLVSCSCAVALIVGRGRRSSGAPVGPPRRLTPLELVTPTSVLARAQASARARSAFGGAGSGHSLAHLRELPPAGQPDPDGDGPASDRTAPPVPAVEIVLHVAENDPQRMAEVITQWITDDRTSPGFDRR